MTGEKTDSSAARGMYRIPGIPPSLFYGGRFIFLSLHSRHLLPSKRYPPSLSLVSTVLPSDPPPNWSSAVHSSKQGLTSVPRWFSVRTGIPTMKGCVILHVWPPPSPRLLVLCRWLRSYMPGCPLLTAIVNVLASSSSSSSSLRVQGGKQNAPQLAKLPGG